MRVAARLPLGLLAVGTLLTAGCQDRDPVLPHTQARTTQQPVEDPPLSPHDLQTISRFDVEVRAPGRIRLGQPITLVATARANLPTQDAQLQIWLPEITPAQSSGWKNIEVPVGARIPAHASRRGGIAQGGEARLQETVVIPEPGYYRVVASAFKTSDEAAMVDGKYIQDESHAELWLWVDERGGQVTTAFDPSLFPEGVRRQPGPFTPERGRSRLRARPGSPSIQTSISPVPTSLSVWITYDNQTNGTTDPLPNAAYYYEVYDYLGNFVHSRSGSTGPNGHIPVECYKDGYGRYGSFSGDVWLTNSNVQVIDDFAGYFGGDFNYDCGLPITAKMWSADRSHVFANMNRSITRSRSTFGYSRGKIKVTVNSTSGNGAVYNRFFDDIKIYANAIWGSYGMFGAGHEYGHALHHKALNGIRGGCSGDHYLEFPSSPGCAFSEGFANFHSAITLGMDIPSYWVGYSTYSLAAWENNNNYYQGGISSEGPVGSFFLDLADDANTPDNLGGDDDTAPYGGYYVAYNVANCSVTWREKWEEDMDGIIQQHSQRPNSVDQMVMCYERAPNPEHTITVLDSYNQPTYLYAVSVGGIGTMPTNWSKAEVSRIYRWNIGRQY